MDEIIAEVRRAREQLVSEHDNDLHSLCNKLRKQEATHPERILDLAAQKERKGNAA